MNDDAFNYIFSIYDTMLYSIGFSCEEDDFKECLIATAFLSFLFFRDIFLCKKRFYAKNDKFDTCVPFNNIFIRCNIV